MGIRFNFSDSRGLSINDSYCRLSQVTVKNGEFVYIAYDIFVSKAKRDESLSNKISGDSSNIPSKILVDNVLVDNPEYEVILAGDILIGSYKYLMNLPEFTGSVIE